MRKIIIPLLACLLFVSASGLNAKAAAYSYSATFTPPYVGSAKSTGYQPPFLYPCLEVHVNSQETSYVLRKAGDSNPASNYIHTGTAGYYPFTYRDGYGIFCGEAYNMVYYPRYSSFTTYSVWGTWQP